MFQAAHTPAERRGASCRLLPSSYGVLLVRHSVRANGAAAIHKGFGPLDASQSDAIAFPQAADKFVRVNCLQPELAFGHAVLFEEGIDLGENEFARLFYLDIHVSQSMGNF